MQGIRETSRDIPQLEAMRLGVFYRQPISIRGFSLSVRPLTHMEMVGCTQNVAEKISRMPMAFQNAVAEHSMLCKEILVLASTSDVGANDPMITEYILDRMTNEELEFLFKQYVSICDKCNPALDSLPKEELERLVAEVKKKPDQATQLSFTQLVSIVRSLLTSEG